MDRAEDLTSGDTPIMSSASTASSALPTSSTASESAQSKLLRPHSTMARSTLKNQLRFSSLGLYGREEQISQLRDAYLRVQKDDSCGVQMVLVKGNSGTGKSAVVHKFRDNTVFQQKTASTRITRRSSIVNSGGAAFFASGKFEQHRGGTEPFSAFASALSQLCDDILALDDTVQEIEKVDEKEGDEDGDNEKTVKDVSNSVKLSDKIREAVGTEGAVLAGVMPNLKRILGDCSDTDTDDDRSTASDGDLLLYGPMALNRFHYVFRSFARAVCSPSRPVVLFLDDLQWADAASLDLLQMLVTDRELKGLLLVGCYRDNEVEEATHPLAAIIREIEAKPGRSEEGKLLITRINVGNLSIEMVNELLSDLLASDESQTLELAKIVHKKTDGNAFFVKQFLESLRDNGMLYYCYATCRWKWDMDKIRSRTSVADNVAGLMRDRLQTKLSTFAREILEMAACLGSTFDELTILIVAESIHKRRLECAVGGETKADECEGHPMPASQEFYGQAVTRCLGVCVEEGLLDRESCVVGTESETAKGYRFVHDQIQLAAYSLIPEQERSLLQVLIGQALVDNLSWAQLKKVLFVAVDLLNSGVGSLSTEQGPELIKRNSLAALNLKAGQKAMQSSAFVPAAGYLKVGIGLLGRNHWEDDYKLSIDLYSLAADAEYSSGNFDQMRLYVDEVLAQTQRPFLDKFPAYAILIKSLVSEEKLSEAVDTSLYVLAQMGVHFPKFGHKIVVLPDLIKTKLLLRDRPTHSLIDLPILRDKIKIKAMQIMDNLATAAYFAAPDLLPLLILRMVRWSVKFGNCKYSAFAYSGYGIVLCGALGEMQEGHEFGKLAVAVVEKLNAKDREARTIVVVHLLIDHWSKPLQLSLNPFLRGYQAGMESGDLESAMYCVVRYCSFAFISGRPLASVEADTRAYTAQIEEYNQQSALSLALVQWQFVLNLMGHSENPTILTGEAMDQDFTLERAMETKNISFKDFIKSHQMWLAYYFGDYELAQRLIKETKDVAVTNTSTYVVWRSAFFEGLTACAVARKSNTRGSRNRARKVKNRIKAWTKKGNVNCHHMVSLLEAEMAALEGRKEEAKRAYDEAITIAARHGLRHDRALANERAGEFFLESGDREWASHHLGLAHQLYVEWEAWAKVDQLRTKHASLLVAIAVNDKPTPRQSSRRRQTLLL